MKVTSGTDKFPFSVEFTDDEAIKIISFNLLDYDEINNIEVIPVLWADIEEWLKEASIDYNFTTRKILFKTQEDVTMFILRWTHIL